MMSRLPMFEHCQHDSLESTLWFADRVVNIPSNPAILDGINLNDDDQRLFVVSRSDVGDTRIKRIQMKPEVAGKRMKLSEMWMNGMLGGLPENF